MKQLVSKIKGVAVAALTMGLALGAQAGILVQYEARYANHTDICAAGETADFDVDTP